ncbi:hypothetical protein [Geoalkalibacter halelectricus]|uniref:hypothetical protein n=1 Tax=Geoalkalibacter halelectricus TaxID=2847045 RepID=UPI003D246F2F
MRETFPLILLIILFLLGASGIVALQNMEPSPEQELRLNHEALKYLEKNGMLEQYLNLCGKGSLQ